ncbi:MAG: FecR domain-containing protein [Leptospiraceae bacterium]|nr:FecR domain-containing protein [Leptospiraceae bacterium]
MKLTSILILTFLLANTAVSSAESETSVQEITVEKGETLSKISKKYLDDPSRWKDLLKYNKISNPNLIYPGQKLKVPGFLQKKALASVILKLGPSKYLTESEKTWKETFVSLKLFRKDQVRTEAKGRLQLQLNSQSVLKIEPDSLVVIDDGNASNASTALNLRQGAVMAIIRNGGQPSNFRIRTPATVMAVRGTQFFASTDAAESLMGVHEGKVNVSAQGKDVLVPEGYGTRVETGKAPEEPFKLIDAPIILEPSASNE